MVTDKYGNKTCLGLNEYSLELFQAIQPFRMDEYCFPQFNERASIQDNTDATGLVREPQLELTAILKVRIECHWLCYVIIIMLCVVSVCCVCMCVCVCCVSLCVLCCKCVCMCLSVLCVSVCMHVCYVCICVFFICCVCLNVVCIVCMCLSVCVHTCTYVCLILVLI